MIGNFHLFPGCESFSLINSLVALTTIALAGYTDGAFAPALFSGSREAVRAALPARPAALRRNPASRVFHVVTALQVRLITAGLLVALCRPPRLSGAGCGSFGVMEAVMLHKNS